MTAVRNHPVVGSLFLLIGLALFGMGATARSAPAFLRDLPVAPEVLVPFLFWQLAVWALLFGVFFLRPRRAKGERGARAVPRV